MAEELVSILDGNTFVVSDARGDIEVSPAGPTGLFAFDTRHLSTWVLTIDGKRLNALSTDDLQYFEAQFFLVPGTGTTYIDAKVSVIRRRTVQDGFHEELSILNHAAEPIDLRVRIDAESDFADLFEVKDTLPKEGQYDSRIEEGRLVLGYQRGTFRRETSISTTAPADLDDRGMTFEVTVEAHGRWTTDVDVRPAMLMAGQLRQLSTGSRSRRGRGRDLARDLEAWLGRAPKLECDWEPLRTTYQRSLIDLAALRFSPVIAGGRSLPAAGLPWFMTMFGRDSICQRAPGAAVRTRVARATLNILEVAGQSPRRVSRRAARPRSSTRCGTAR